MNFTQTLDVDSLDVSALFADGRSLQVSDLEEVVSATHLFSFTSGDAIK